MKQTITTEHYKTNVDIPIEKLTRPCTQKRVQNQQNRQTYIVLQGPNCQGCPCGFKGQVTIEMLEDLERAYDKDMKEMKMRIAEVEEAKLDVETKLKLKIGELDQLGTLWENQKKSLTTKVQKAQEEKHKLQIELERCKRERQAVLRAKINQFQTQILAAEMRHEQTVKLLKLELQNSFEQSLKRKQEENKLSLATFQAKIGQLSATVTGAEERYERLLREKQGWRNKQAQMYTTISTHLSKVSSLEAQNKILCSEIEKLNEALRGGDRSLQARNERVIQLEGCVEELKKCFDEEKAELKSIAENLNAKYNESLRENKELEDKYLEVSSYSQQLQKDIAYLHQIIAQKEQPLHKDEKKVYQVRIQKVIDRSSYIQQLEDTIERLRRQCLQYSEDLKKEEQIRHKHTRIIEDFKLEIIRLEATTAELKAYIQEKEKSFAWMVEREVSRDMQLNQHEKNRTYRVFPLKEKEQPPIKLEGSRRMDGEVREILIRPEQP